MGEALDLTAYDQRHAALTADVESAAETLRQAQSKLADFRAARKNEVVQLIGAGASTGNELYDEAIVIFDVDEDFIPRLLELNQQLIAAAGKQCLLKFSWQEQMVFRGSGEPPRQGDFERVTAEILGILSGERLTMSCKGRMPHNFEISFPFARFAAIGIGHDRTVGEVKKGEPFVLTTNLSLKGPDCVAFLQFVKGHPYPVECSMVIDPPEHTVSSGLLKLLATATEAEIHSAAGI